MLEKSNSSYKVIEYANGKDFTKRFPEEAYWPAIVLMDIAMPEMDGFATCQWLKNEYPGIPILIISFTNNQEVCLALSHYGINGMVSKNVDPQLLITAIDRIINGEPIMKQGYSIVIRMLNHSIQAKEMKALML